MAQAGASGLAIRTADGLIAAEFGVAVATRDTPPFRGTDLPVIGPWAASP